MSSTPLVPSDKNVVDPPKMPWLKVAQICLIQFCEAFSIYLILPFVPFMVSDFFPLLPEKEIGYYTGYLSSALFIGQVIGAPIWGYLSDHWGRRPALIFGIVGTMFSLTLFAFSQNFWWAVGARFLWGVLNGNVGIAKTSLSEICPEAHMPKAMGCLGTMWGFGEIFGPFFGGLLARPASKFSFCDTAFLRKFPYVLPFCVPFVVSFFSFFGTVFYLPESKQPTSEVHSFAKSASQQDKSANDETDPNRDSSEKIKLLSTPPMRPSFYRTICRKKPCLSILMYAIFGSLEVGFMNIIPIWLLVPSSFGGMGFDSTTVGTVLSVGGPFSILWAMLVFPRIIARFGYLSSLRFCCCWFGLLVFLLPFTGPMSAGSVGLQWTLACVSRILVVLPAGVVFPIMFILINNSTPTSLRGRVNGVGQTAVSIMRILSPVIFSNLFAWSEGNGLGWPFDFHFSFHLIGILCSTIVIISFFLPKSIERSYGIIPSLRKQSAEEEEEKEAV